MRHRQEQQRKRKQGRAKPRTRTPASRANRRKRRRRLRRSRMGARRATAERQLLPLPQGRPLAEPRGLPRLPKKQKRTRKKYDISPSVCISLEP